MLYNAEDFNLNAHDDIQEPYSEYDYKKDPVAMGVLQRLHDERKKELDNVRKYNRHPIAGAAIGGGIGYKIGAHYAKKTPLISQQRKRKIVGTVIGAGIGAGIGYNIKTKRSQASIDAESNPIKAKYEERRERLFNNRRKLYESQVNSQSSKSDSPKVDPALKSAPVSPTSPSEAKTGEQSDKFFGKYSFLRKKK